MNLFSLESWTFMVFASKQDRSALIQSLSTNPEYLKNKVSILGSNAYILTFSVLLVIINNYLIVELNIIPQSNTDKLGLISCLFKV